MPHSQNRALDELAKLITDAVGAAGGVRREVETLVRSQGERLVRDMELVRRDEFDVVRTLAIKAREENERLEARVAALEARLAALEPKR